MKKVYGGILLAVGIALLIGAVCMYGRNGKLKQYQGQFFECFDTVTTITGYAGSQEEFSEKMELLKEKLLYYHRLYDIYHTYDGVNNLKTINDAAGVKAVKVEPEIMELLKLGREMYEQTEGKFQIAYGSVLSLWHDYREQGLSDPKQAKLPSKEELAKRAQHTDMEALILDEAASTVYLSDPEMSLDVGGIGKGYAAQRLAEYAKELGMEHVLISVGGNVSAVGEKIDGKPWRVGVENPNQESTEPYVSTLDIADQNVVTSGDYQRYYEVDGKRYCHIIDPHTNMPPEYFASVSVLAEDSGRADALSTALFNMEFEEGLSLVEGLKDVEAMWIGKDGEIRSSSGWKANEKE